ASVLTAAGSAASAVLQATGNKSSATTNAANAQPQKSLEELLNGDIDVNDPAQKQALTNAIAKAENDMATIDSNIATLEAENRTLEATTDKQIQDNVNELATELGNAAQQANEADAAIAENNAAQEALKQRSAENAEAAQQNQTQQAENAQQTDEARTAETEQSKVEQDKTQQKQGLQETQNGQIDKLNECTGKQQALADAVTLAKSDLDAANNALSVAESRITQAESSLKTAKSNKDENAKTQAQTQLTNAKTAKTQAKEKVKTAESKKKEAEEAQEKNEKEISKLKKQITFNGKTLASLEQEAAAAKANKEQAMAIINEKADELKGLVNEQQVIQDSENQIAIQQAQSDSAIDQNMALANACKSFQDKGETINADLNEARATISEKIAANNAKIGEYTTQKEQLQAKITQGKQKLGIASGDNPKDQKPTTPVSAVPDDKTPAAPGDGSQPKVGDGNDGNIFSSPGASLWTNPSDDSSSVSAGNTGSIDRNSQAYRDFKADWIRSHPNEVVNDAVIDKAFKANSAK
ncbi:hypothetical protein IJ707_01865, partial [bacterium]|nr:hypothetical protein [bacterium]